MTAASGTAHRTGAPRPVTPVGILAAELAAVVRGLDAADGVPAEVTDGARRAHDLAAGLDPYLDRGTTPESPALRALGERTAAEDWDAADGAVPLEQEMLSGHVEGRFLAFLVHLTRATRVLEIGMFTGYSALAMAEALDGDGELVACEVDAHAAAIARECFDASPAGERIRVEVAPALDTLARLADAGESFDLVFVDADKAGYAAYLDAVLDTGLLAPDGVVCVDNTLMQGEPYLPGPSSANGTAIAAFNQAVVDDTRVEQVMLPLRDGLTLVRRI